MCARRELSTDSDMLRPASHLSVWLISAAHDGLKSILKEKVLLYVQIMFFYKFVGELLSFCLLLRKCLKARQGVKNVGIGVRVV